MKMQRLANGLRYVMSAVAGQMGSAGVSVALSNGHEAATVAVAVGTLCFGSLHCLLCIMTIQSERLTKQISVISLDECSDSSDLVMTESTVDTSHHKREPEDQQHEPTASRSAASSGFRRVAHHERSDSYQIRSRLLNRLGIEKEYVGYTAQRMEASRVVQQGEVGAFNIPLKADHGMPDRRLESSSSLSSLATSPGLHHILEKRVKRGTVCFDASVRVHPIPARSDYSKRMRSVMWISNTEIQQNAARNSLEFAAEQWDVAKVVEDDGMVLYAGERVHPIHFVPESILDQRFSSVHGTSCDEY
jgi:hypothetical protein